MKLPLGSRPTDARRRNAMAGSLTLIAAAIIGVASAADDKVQLDPFARATSGYPACPEVAPPLLTSEHARTEAHVRVERGLRCAMEGTCEPGGAYRRDPELNERVRATISSDARFASTSVWVTTSRKWVTLQGCVRDKAQQRKLVAFVAALAGVDRVFDELVVGTGQATKRAPGAAPAAKPGGS